KAEEFQKFLFQSAVTMMACDGSIEEKEINEIKNIVENEIYFIGYDYEQPLRDNIDYIKTDANRAINQYLNNLSSISLSEKQELLLIEVLLRIIESDKRVEKNEVKFLQMIKSKLKTNE